MRSARRRAVWNGKFLRGAAREAASGDAAGPTTACVHENRRSAATAFKRVDVAPSGRAFEVQAHLLARGSVGFAGLGGLERAAHERVGAAGAREAPGGRVAHARVVVEG